MDKVCTLYYNFTLAICKHRIFTNNIHPTLKYYRKIIPVPVNVSNYT